MKKAIPSAASVYEEQLMIMKEINEDGKAHGKKPFDDGPGEGEQKQREAMVSTTDPDSGMFCKGDHKHCFAYEAHTVCDRHNFILDTVVTSGNVHDSVAFDALYEKVTGRFPEIRTVTMDAGYKTPWICKRIIDDGRIPCLPYKRPMTKKGFHEWYVYINIWTWSSDRNTEACRTARPTRRATGNIRVRVNSVKHARPDICVQRAGTVRRE